MTLVALTNTQIDTEFVGMTLVVIRHHIWNETVFT